MPPELLTVSVKVTVSPGFFTCSSACDFVSRICAAFWAVFMSIPQPAGTLLLVHRPTSAAVGIPDGMVGSPPPPMRALLVYWLPLAIAPALAVRMN